jgi:hypothetical protein
MSSPRRASFRRAKITVKGAPEGASPTAMAPSTTLDTDLPRQEPAPIRRTDLSRLDLAASPLTLKHQDRATVWAVWFTPGPGLPNNPKVMGAARHRLQSR